MIRKLSDREIIAEALNIMGQLGEAVLPVDATAIVYSTMVFIADQYGIPLAQLQQELREIHHQLHKMVDRDAPADHLPPDLKNEARN